MNNSNQTYKNNSSELSEKNNRIGVLFDLDGVIIDSESEYTRIWNKIEEEYPTGIKDFSIKIKGTNLNNILDTYFPDSEIRKKVESRLYELEGLMKYVYLDGAREVLIRLKNSNVPMALYTSSDHYKMQHLYKDIPELKSFFKYIVLGDMVTKSKPDPEGYLKAAEGLGLSDGKWIVVEDSLQGCRAGKASGGKVIGVAGTLPKHILSPECDIVIDSMTKFPFEYLEKLIR